MSGNTPVKFPFVTLKGISQPANSAPGEARLYFDPIDSKLKFSEDGSSYVALSSTGGANTALSNLSSTSVNQTLKPGTDAAVHLGTASLRWGSLYTSTAGVNLVSTALETGTARNWSISIQPAGSLLFKEGTTNIISALPSGYVGIGTATPNSEFHLLGAHTYAPGLSSPALSPLGQARIYFDSGTNKLKISENGSAYIDLIAAASLSAASPLNGNGSISFPLYMTQASGSLDGYLKSSDWVTFNSKESVLSFTSPLGRSVNTITLSQASGITDGYLSSSDWTTFNSKESALTFNAPLTRSVNSISLPEASISSDGYVTTSAQSFAGAKTFTGLVTSSTAFNTAFGSAAAPTFTFTGDTDTGIWHPATNEVGIAAGGVNVVLVSSGGVGIGTNAPTAYFHVYNNQNAETLTRVENTTNNTGASAGLLLATSSGYGSLQAFPSAHTAAGAYLASKLAVYNQTMPGGLIIADATNGGISFTTGATPTASIERLKISTAEVVINDPGNSVDFRARGVTNQNLLFVDASTDRVGIGTNTPTSFLHSTGSISLPLTTKTSNYTATISDYTILCDAFTATITITLPAASTCTNRLYVIKKIDLSANAVIIDANASETIDGSLTYTLNSQYETITVQSSGTDWWVL